MTAAGTTTRWPAGFDAVLGLWLIAASFVFRPGTTALWNDVVVGALVAVLGGYNAHEANRAAGTAGQQAETGAYHDSKPIQVRRVSP